MSNLQGAGWSWRPTPGWRDERGPLLVGIGLAGAALLLACGVIAWTRGRPIAAIVLAVLAAALGRVVVSSYPRRRRSGSLRTVSMSGQPGILIPVRRMRLDVIASLFLLAAGFLFGAAVLVYVTIDKEKPVVAIGVFVLGAIGFVCGKGASAAFAAHRRAHLGIVLTPDHVVMETAVPVLIIPWAQVSAFRTFSLQTSMSTVFAIVQNWIAVAVRDPTQVPNAEKPAALLARRFTPGVVAVLTTRQLAVDPQRALDLLHFYLDNPEARAELGTDRPRARFER